METASATPCIFHTAKANEPFPYTRLVAEAKKLGINISRVAEGSIAKAVTEEKTRLWKIENPAAIEAWNEYVERNGLPLTKYRQF
jgi:antitoxin CcdA